MSYFIFLFWDLKTLALYVSGAIPFTLDSFERKYWKYSVFEWTCLDSQLWKFYENSGVLRFLFNKKGATASWCVSPGVALYRFGTCFEVLDGFLFGIAIDDQWKQSTVSLRTPRLWICGRLRFGSGRSGMPQLIRIPVWDFFVFGQYIRAFLAFESSVSVVFEIGLTFPFREQLPRFE